MTATLWNILTGGGAGLRGQFYGTREGVEKWCRDHYIVWQIEEASDDQKAALGDLLHPTIG